ncbi:TIGR01777 family protein, partial [candidate division KSB3 bacterium]|nr:TIGR01777 family protein [candidate division KSB3 bacterium]MBD3323316.1 TIGR01777 family protein [candidate division KSB3 bacterium]
SPDTPSWDPLRGTISPGAFTNIDAVIHLAGENIGDGRWTATKKERIRQSRVQGTRVLCEHLARLDHKPSVLLAASGVGIYGDHGDEWVDEGSAPGEGFLATAAQEWEAATRPALQAGIRVVHMRLGVVLSRTDGALQKMLLPFQLGVGGKLGSGRQYMSWISLPDVVEAIPYLLTHDSITSPVNLVSPHPVRNAQFSKTLGHVLHRPALFSVPAVGLRVLFGEMADEVLLTSTRAKPQTLLDAGYAFLHPNLEDALQAVLWGSA